MFFLDIDHEIRNDYIKIGGTQTTKSDIIHRKALPKVKSVIKYGIIIIM